MKYPQKTRKYKNNFFFFLAYVMVINEMHKLDVESDMRQTLKTSKSKTKVTPESHFKMRHETERDRKVKNFH